ncbi:uncharacterized protein LOC126252492 [Schistocerca nitens]|uniref:uncharacterized protein LOC126252492 n=1 Tax=Schistocerca nitens TaxID=7011 RepID=UPI0021187EB5|nr:uncharacterized protein LOC126252492 [Schistocerca nitens]
MAQVEEWRSVIYVLLAAAVACTQARSVLETNSVDPADEDEGTWSTVLLRDLRMVYKTYRDCETRGKDVTTCLKVKLLTELDRAARSRAPNLRLVDGLVTLVRDDSADGADSRPLPSEQQLVETLPRSAEDKQQSLDALLVDRASAFLRSRSLQLNLGEAAAQIVEGRRKRDKMGGLLLLLPVLMGGMLIPLALGGLALLAGKALLVAKLALVLSSLLGLRKLLGDGGGAQHEPVVQVVSPPHHGLYGRSIDLSPLQHTGGAHDLAYRAHAARPSVAA